MKKYKYFFLYNICMARKNDTKAINYLYVRFGKYAEEIFSFLVRLYGKKKVMKMVREIVFDLENN